MAKKYHQQKQTQRSTPFIYQTRTGALELRGDATHETVWATQAQMAQMFGVNSPAITKHIRNIYQEQELSESATCSSLEQVQKEGNREITRSVNFYNLDVIISVGYRINSVVGTSFRIWATKTLKQHITAGYTINRARIAKNYDEFMAAVNKVQSLLPPDNVLDSKSTLDLVWLFANTWFSLDVYDKESLTPTKVTKKKVTVTAKELQASIEILKKELISKGEATSNFAQERNREALEGIVGNVM